MAQSPSETLSARLAGRWRSILPAVGVDPKCLTGKHCPCPVCGGKDRFRFDDKDGRGTFFCSQCGPGDGPMLVMAVNRVDFRGAAKLIEPHVPSSKVAACKARRSFDQNKILRIWNDGTAINPADPAGLYLAKRGVFTDSPQLRFVSSMGYRHEDGKTTYHPAMVARFVAPDFSSMTVHATYLTELGDKASVPKVKKLAQAPVPVGGAVRLGLSSGVMGIAEGIETALSASLIWKVPVWAGLSANGLLKWEPPPTARKLIVFGDRDESFAGQNVAYGLAYRLKGRGYDVDVILPDLVGEDWNDFLRRRGA